MRPVRIQGADPLPLGAPANWSEERDGHCGALFVRRERHGEVAYMRSAWEVEPTEAIMLFAGAQMTLGVGGDRHPVVQLGVADLPPDFDPVVSARRFTDRSGQPMARVEMLFPHGGTPRRGYVNVHVDGTLADAVSSGIAMIEELARREGWVS